MQNTPPVVVYPSQQLCTSQIVPNAPLLTSVLYGWDGICLQYARQPAWETPEHYSTQHLILIRVSNDVVNAERKLDERKQQERFGQGDTVIIPASVPHQAVWDGAGEIVSLSIEPNWLAETVNVDSAHYEMIPHFAHFDPLIYGIGQALKQSLEVGSFKDRLYVDALTNALAVYLIRHYATREQRLGNYTGGLAKNKLQAVIDYIQAHSNRDLGVGELAAIAQMSRYHFSRLFKQSTGLAPHQYVLQCRISKAKQLLAAQLPISEIYQEVGFQSQSHFTKVFRKYTGVTPKAYRAERS